MIPNLPINNMKIPRVVLEEFRLQGFKHVKLLIWEISLWSTLTVIVFIHAHLRMTLNLPIKFTKIPRAVQE